MYRCLSLAFPRVYPNHSFRPHLEIGDTKAVLLALSDLDSVGFDEVMAAHCNNKTSPSDYLNYIMPLI